MLNYFSKNVQKLNFRFIFSTPFFRAFLCQKFSILSSFFLFKRATISLAIMVSVFYSMNMDTHTKRIPKNYDGSAPTGRQIRDLLPDVLSKLAKKCNDNPHQILAAWPEIVGERIGKMSRAVAYDSGVLKVYVKNSTLYSLLVEHEKMRLIAAFKKRFPKVNFRDIFFKIGN